MFQRRPRNSRLAWKGVFSSQHRPVLTRNERLRFEELEPGTMPDATPVISECLAANGNGIKDEDGDSSDWIEIFNPTSSAVNLQGWRLTDDSADLAKWTFPSASIDAGGYLLVFASYCRICP